MKIIAEIDGWRKILDVPDHCARSGKVNISQIIPPHLNPNLGSPTKSDKAQIFTLYDTGTSCQGLPLFKWGML